MMGHYDYQTLIRKYSEDVAAGYADTDLEPRQRRLVAIMLNLASNHAGYAPYPPSADDRDHTVKAWTTGTQRHGIEVSDG